MLVFALVSQLLAAEPSCRVELFRIERSKNANVVLYERGEGDEPVRASWLLLAGNGAREPLSLFERAFAYGFDVRRAGEVVELTLKAFKQRVIKLVSRSGCLAAVSVIDGKLAVLERIFVKATDGLAPAVEFIELYGLDAETGEARSERLMAR